MLAAWPTDLKRIIYLYYQQGMGLTSQFQDASVHTLYTLNTKRGTEDQKMLDASFSLDYFS